MMIHALKSSELRIDGELGPPSLDLYKRNRNTWCGTEASVGRVVGPDGQRYAYAAIPCKSWHCEVCGPVKAARIRCYIVTAALEHELNRFLTLTLDPKRLDMDGDLTRYLREVWRKFRVYLKRRYGKSISFIAIMEEHKSGIPHLHVLIDRYIPQAWISAAWSALGGGRIVYIERVKDLAAIGWYLGKYLTKDMLLSAKRGVRRYSTSRNIRLGPKRGKSGWTPAPAGISELRRAAGKKALAVVENERGVRYFETEQPLRRMKVFSGKVMLAEPLPEYVNPDERDGVATWEEVIAVCEELRDEGKSECSTSSEDGVSASPVVEKLGTR